MCIRDSLDTPTTSATRSAEVSAGLAFESVLGHDSVKQIAVDSVVDAFVAGPVAGMAVALTCHQDTGVQLLGQGRGPRIGRRRVTGRPYHHDRFRTVAVDRDRLLGRLARPVGATQCTPGEDAAKNRCRLDVFGLQRIDVLESYLTRVVQAAY